MNRQLKFPKLQSIKIKNFSLYSGVPEVYVEFDKPVICLAGANGLGKSTFLNIICYSLTGWIRDPDQKFYAVKDIFGKNKNDRRGFAFEYFEGRIQNSNSNTAEVELRFQIHNTDIVIKRGFIEENAFISMEYYEEEIKKEIFDEVKYEEMVTRLMGLRSFEQFVFLIHYILLFDENRKLIFWDSNVLTATLYLLLGLDIDDAVKADELSRRIDQLDSQARNISWDISKARQYISNLKKDKEKIKNQNKDEDLREFHKELSNKFDELKSKVEEAKYKLNSYNSQMTDLSAKIFSLQNEYEKIYNTLFESDSKERVINHPIVKKILESYMCEVCGSNKQGIKIIVENNIAKNVCPLCKTNLDNSKKQNTDKKMERLKEIDSRLIELKTKIKELQNNYNQTKSLITKLISERDKKQQELIELESKLVDLKNTSQEEGPDAINSLISHQLKLISSYQARKEELMKKREKAKSETVKLRRKLTKAYAAAEKDFLPIFKKMAEKFIGLKVNIQLKEIIRKHRPELRFLLELEDSDRLYKHQLSESQKFFIDIALRLSFIIYNSKDQTGGLMLLDTPEGSLDIAYETNAGEMLFEYTEEGKQLIMTANLNSSGFIKTLASLCKNDKFNLIRMIDWANLTDVHLNKYSLFENVLDDIEKELR